ncbi:MAG TPA: heavy metal sensor histidine kinase [Gemmataceae bacterium]|nr:heavy metal sensor histidine kinase [Gemmataceae bacterium]
MSSTHVRKPTVPWSLAARLTAWYAGSAFLLILAATAFLYWALVANLDREDDQYLADKVRILRAFIRDKPHDAAPLKQEAEWEWAASQHAQFCVRILDGTGRPIVETPGMQADLSPDLFPAPSAADAEPDRGVEIDSPSGKSFRVLAARATVGASEDAERVIQVALDRTVEEDLLTRYRRDLWIVLGTALIACTFVGYQIARRGLQPVTEITSMARRIRSTTLNERIEASGLPAELWELAGTFNQMLDRLEESFNRLAQFSADIAHELRTPVNNLRGEAEVALGQARAPEEYREVLGSCLEECSRLARIIDSLLFLARAESPEIQIARERVDLARELTAACEFYEAAAAEAGIALRLNCPAGLLVPLDRTLFQRALGNLVANALAHTAAGGTVVLTADRNGDTLRVDITDSGCGIPAAHLPHVFDRFYRVDGARSNASGRVGLGLAIVKSIASLHRGSVSIHSTLGKGTRVTLVFPSD